VYTTEFLLDKYGDGKLILDGALAESDIGFAAMHESNATSIIYHIGPLYFIQPLLDILTELCYFDYKSIRKNKHEARLGAIWN
jgi:hypothetical protein